MGKCHTGEPDAAAAGGITGWCARLVGSPEPQRNDVMPQLEA